MFPILQYNPVTDSVIVSNQSRPYVKGFVDVNDSNMAK